MINVLLSDYQSGKRGSNARPTAWEAVALPTELLPLIFRIETKQIYKFCLIQHPNDSIQNHATFLTSTLLSIAPKKVSFKLRTKLIDSLSLCSRLVFAENTVITLSVYANNSLESEY